MKQGTVVIADYFYDYQGRRTRKAVGTTVTVYHYDQENHLIAETNAAGTLLRTYVWRGDAPITQIDTTGGQDKTYYLEVDTLGTPRTARNDTGAIVWQWYADAFGNTAALEDPDGDGQAARINLRFPGQYFDAETGLHYNMARYYNPGNGRYLQPDPIGLAGGINTFAYTGNNPVNLSDPTGNCPWCVVAWAAFETGSSLYDIYNAAQTVSDNCASNGEKFAAVGGAILGIVGPGGGYGTAAKSSVWTSTKYKTSVENAYRHWKDHGSDFPQFQNAKQYVDGTKNFVNAPPPGTLVKTRSNGDKLFYDPASNTFAVTDINGAPRTMFKPSDGMGYWNRQK